MKKEHSLTLINGIFDNADTIEIILSLIDKKIKFNEINSFRNLIKSKEQDKNLEKRIEELKKARVSFLEYMHFHKKDSFKIDSIINIKSL